MKKKEGIDYKGLAELLKDRGYTVDEFSVMDEPPWPSRDAEDIIDWNEFVRAIKSMDFAVGDSFWLNDVEFEVKTVNLG